MTSEIVKFIQENLIRITNHSVNKSYIEKSFIPLIKFINNSNSNRFLLSGSHIVRWNGKDNYGFDTPSGIYIYHLVSSDKSISNKMILLR